jgi:hypothetical protein
MLGWIQRFFRTLPRVEFFPDAIAMKQSGAALGLKKAIEQRLTEDILILIVCHFPSTFFETQDWLDEWGLRYEIPTTPLRPQQIASIEPFDERPRLRLVLSEMLEIETGLSSSDPGKTLSVMVTERHLLSTHDRRIATFCHQLPHPVKLGYFLSLDAPAIGPLIGDWTEEILKQWGMNDVDLITSELVTRRLDRARKWLDKEVRKEQVAESPRDWWMLNVGSTRYAQAFQSYLDRNPSLND